MGCVSSNLLNNEEEITRLGSSALSQHIVSLTSTTYGLLNLDPPHQNPNLHSPSTPPPRFTLGSIFPNPLSLSEPRSVRSEPKTLRSDPDVINSWELMAGLDADSFRFYPLPKPKTFADKENSSPNFSFHPDGLKDKSEKQKPILFPSSVKSPLDRFEALCPPNGENKVVIYTTTLRGVRKTFESCNAVRSALEGFGISICERDVSMDQGFREELSELMKEKEDLVPPRVFVKGRYVGGAEEVLRMAEEGKLGDLLHGLPKKSSGDVCEGCGNVRFLPCFHCNGSCKVVMVMRENMGQKQRKSVVVRCSECNENGLVLCPICS